MTVNKLLLNILLIIILIWLILTLNTQYNYKSTQTQITSNNIEDKSDSIEIKKNTITNIKLTQNTEVDTSDILYKCILKLDNVNDKKETNLSDFIIAINKYSLQYNIDKYLLISIAYVESRINKYAHSSIGPSCIGIFQLNERAHKLDHNLKYDEDYQVNKACEILVYYKNIYGDNTMRVINGYNGRASSENPYYNKVMRTYNKLRNNI